MSMPATDVSADAKRARNTGLAASLIRLAVACALLAPLGGCSTLGLSSFPSFQFGAGGAGGSPDCQEIEARMKKAQKRYASVLGQQPPAVYLGFSSNLNRTMKKHRLKGIHQLNDLQIDEVVDETRRKCMSQRLPRRVCGGAGRIGKAYRPLILAARDAHANYCAGREIN